MSKLLDIAFQSFKALLAASPVEPSPFCRRTL